ncbi:hypothetical protein [Corynebacterium pseudodiphtheriticum]|uniref:hypothetical protein n=1 Tax=Corynebacterium pseudodiphtheriticum TaxID=37637 RepID=UPI00234CB4D4|nr:hypothetical protein [Corynebacterium pseudodiphtheriticum]MDC7089342.1 hypothetical protein [Corynebacterium pseudodiphtheriticum]MDK4240087.1 hypothetical protein [Corynebacterium pseudodiphtheriticum]MDK4322090.1 hypothetical protein [Corynebacterium pseudodiphtheriticum]
MMVAPLVWYEPEEALEKLKLLEESVEGGIERFEERACVYDLSPKEAAIWQDIRELRWLVGRD